MKTIPKYALNTLYPDAHIWYFKLAIHSFIIASLMGVLASISVGASTELSNHFDLRILRPLHTLWFIVAVLAGVVAFVHQLVETKPYTLMVKAQQLSMILFIVLSNYTLLSGVGSGREYFSWTFGSDLSILAVFIILFNQLLHNWQALEQRSPEAFWLLSLGCSFIFLGLLESQYWQFRQLFTHYITDLSIQWHGIDTFFAGINTALYGGGAYLLGSKPKPLRKSTLFVIAAFSLLFTFGHHHYVSPQPTLLKNFALIASLLAIFSFWRHVKAYKKMNVDQIEKKWAFSLWKSIEFWTLVSVASGVIFAIPQLNLIIHGTYLVVIHAMGSMIGVNLMIIVLGGLSCSKRSENLNAHSISMAVKFVNVSLILLWIDLAASGLTKGILRVNYDYAVYQTAREIYLMFFPLIGFVLALSILYLGILVLNANKVSIH